MAVETVKEHLERQRIHVKNCDCNCGILIDKAPEIQKYFYEVKGYWRIVNCVMLAWS